MGKNTGGNMFAYIHNIHISVLPSFFPTSLPLSLPTSLLFLSFSLCLSFVWLQGEGVNT